MLYQALTVPAIRAFSFSKTREPFVYLGPRPVLRVSSVKCYWYKFRRASRAGRCGLRLRVRPARAAYHTQSPHHRQARHAAIHKPQQHRHALQNRLAVKGWPRSAAQSAFRPSADTRYSVRPAALSRATTATTPQHRRCHPAPRQQSDTPDARPPLKSRKTPTGNPTMSLDDRDWYREEMKRRRHNQQPPKRGYIHPALRRHHKPQNFNLKRFAHFLAFCAFTGALTAIFKHLLSRYTF